MNIAIFVSGSGTNCENIIRYFHQRPVPPADRTSAAAASPSSSEAPSATAAALPSTAAPSTAAAPPSSSEGPSGATAAPSAAVPSASAEVRPSELRPSPVPHIALVVSNRSDAFALERAKRLGVPACVVPKADLNNPDIILPLLRANDIEFIVLAGFLPMVPDFLIEAFPRRIVNIHPALLPRHGGKGMWGHHVHEAVKAAGDTETGITIHYVTPVCDGGEIIAQFSTPLSPEDTPETIADKVHVLEMKHFPEVLERLWK